MTFWKRNHPHQQDRPIEKAAEKTALRTLTAEERRQLGMEMCLGCAMLPPGCFPDGIWYFY